MILFGGKIMFSVLFSIPLLVIHDASFADDH